MVWSNPAPQYDITLPSTANPGDPGSVYIGGPKLPQELKTNGYIFALIWYPNPPDTNKYYYYAVRTNLPFTKWTEGYCNSVGNLIDIRFARATTGPGTNVAWNTLGALNTYTDYINHYTVLDINQTPGAFLSWRGEDYGSRRALLYSAAEVVGVARSQFTVDSLATAQTTDVTLSIFNNSNNPPILTATWHIDATKSYITDSGGVNDAWLPAGLYATGTVGGANYNAYADIYRTYDRTIEIRGSIAFSGSPTTQQITIGGFIPADYIPVVGPQYLTSHSELVLLHGQWIVVGNARNYVSMVVTNTGQLLVRGPATSPASTRLDFGGTWTVPK